MKQWEYLVSKHFPPCFLFILLCFSLKKMFSTIDMSYQYFEDDVEDLPAEDVDSQENVFLQAC